VFARVCSRTPLKVCSFVSVSVSFRSLLFIVKAVTAIYTPDSRFRLMVAKILQSIALKCDDLIVETRPHLFNPPQLRLDIRATMESAVNKVVYHSVYQAVFGFQ